MNTKELHRIKRHTKIRSKVTGTAQRPRLSVYRSLHGLQAQIIDDASGKTLLSGLSHKKSQGEGTGMERAKRLGEAMAKEASSKGITHITFDRGGFRYHGQIKMFADALREAGIKI